MGLEVGQAVDSSTTTGTNEKIVDGTGGDEAEEATSSTCAASGTSMATALGQATAEKADDDEKWPQRLRVELEGTEDPFHWYAAPLPTFDIPGPQRSAGRRPIRKKWVTAGIGCWFCFLAGLAGGALSAVIPQLIEDLDTSREMGELALSIFPLGVSRLPSPSLRAAS